MTTVLKVVNCIITSFTAQRKLIKSNYMVKTQIINSVNRRFAYSPNKIGQMPTLRRQKYANMHDNLL